MTKADILKLALAHGFTVRNQPNGEFDLNPYVYDFARAIAAVEREACAKIADEQAGTVNSKWIAEEIAASIRARGETE